MIAHLRLRRTRVWAVVLALAAAALSFVPLFDLLAYEFCAAMALLSSVAFAHLGRVGAAGRCRDLLAAHGVVLAPPLAIITLNALRVRNCDFIEGLALYGLLPVGSAVCATTVGFVAGRAIARPCLATAAALGAAALSIAVGLARLYVDPALFAYDPFVGFFPGPLYDEDVGASTVLLLYRGMNVAFCAGALAWLAHRRVAAVACLALGLGAFAYGGRLAFRTSHADLHRALRGRLEGPHVILRFDPAKLDRAEAAALLRDHEFRFAQVAAALGVAPRGKIASYVFPSARAKRRIVGAGGTSVAKPWRREMFLNQEDPPHGVLKHEMAHVVAGAAHGGFFGAPAGNLGLVEGLATALEEPVEGGLTLHEQARALRDLGKAPPLASVFGLGLLGEAPARGYTMAGSFVRFLLDRKGAAFVRESYGRGSVAGLAALESQWLAHLAGVAVPAAAREALAERFRRPAIFRRVCAHEIALLRGEAERARGAERVALCERIAGYEPDDPAHLASWARALAVAGDGAGARRVAARAMAHPKATSALRHEMHELAGDLAWRGGDGAAARAAYEAAVREAAGEASLRIVRAKLRALGDGEAEPLYRRFLAPGGERDPLLDALLLRDLAALRPADGFPGYLLGRQLYLRDHFAEAAAEFERAERLGLPDDAYLRECRRLLALAAWRAGDLARASGAAARLADLADTPGRLAEARDLLERFRWEAARQQRQARPAMP